MSKQLIGQRVEFCLDENNTVQSRTFTDTNGYDQRAWREGLAVAVLGDFKLWRHVQLIGVAPIYAED